jgi:hypothetical protein
MRLRPPVWTGALPRPGADETVQQEQIRLQLALVLDTGNGDIGNQGVQTHLPVGTGRGGWSALPSLEQVHPAGRPGDANTQQTTFSWRRADDL